MHRLAVLLLLLPLAACQGVSSAPIDPGDVRLHLDYQLYLLQTGMEREDLLMASSMIDDRFSMAANVSQSFRDKNWEGSGRQAFRSFLNDCFNLHANIDCELVLAELAQSGDLATATVQLQWRSQRTDSIPPGTYIIESEDYFFFQRHGSAWRLLRWQRTPEPPPPFE